MRRVLVAGMVMVTAMTAGRAQGPAQPVLGSRTIPTITVDGLKFRDLNRSGQLDPYEDWRLATPRRVSDLVGRMTLEEKAGVMMHGSAPSTASVVGQGAQYDMPAIERIVLTLHVNSLITRLSGDAATLAQQNNALQEVAERSRLGIPLTVSSDPRHHFQYTVGASVTGGFARWPEALGFAALRDPALMRRFADIARREYRAVGIHEALSPQADIATDPRWPRINGTFGEDPALAYQMVKAYVAGFQNSDTDLARDGVICIVKHWVGYPAAPDGWDGHNYYGRYNRMDGALPQHIRPFEGAFDVKVAGVMPSYTILQDVTVGGVPVEQVAGGYSRYLLTDLLRGTHKFDGVILSDWAITKDCGENCRSGLTKHTPADIATPWGVEDLPVVDRFARGVQAGLDQFGGTDESPKIVEAVRSGKLTEARVNASVTRILSQKFHLGLFENPFVDPAAATTLVESPATRAEADAAQRRALVLLENNRGVLPLKAGARVFVHGMSADAVRAKGFVPVATVAEAEVAIVRTSTPFETLHPNHFFGGRQHEGALDFKDGNADYEQIKAAAAKVPTVVSIYLDRPAILGNVRDKAAAIIGNFGASDEALLDVLAGKAKADGKLPFALPASMADVLAQSPGKPHDLATPLYPFGAGGAR